MGRTQESPSGVCSRCPALLAHVSYCSRCGPPLLESPATPSRSTLDLYLRPVTRRTLSPVMRQVVRWRSLIVVTPLLVALVISGGLGARMLWAEIPTTGPSQASAATTSKSPEATGTKASGDRVIVRCWDLKRAPARDCTVPSGKAGVRWVFPVLDPQLDECRDITGLSPGSERLVEWECDKAIDGRPVLVTFAELTGVSTGRSVFETEYADVDRRSIGDRRDLWVHAEESGEYSYRGAVMYRDHPFAVSVRATTQEDTEQTLREGVTYRPSARVRDRGPR